MTARPLALALVGTLAIGAGCPKEEPATAHVDEGDPVGEEPKQPKEPMEPKRGSEDDAWPTPVAAATALATAPLVGGTPASPMPPGLFALGMTLTSMSGTSDCRMTG